MRVLVQEYDPLWRDQFSQLEQILRHLLKSSSFQAIEHVGSTSVPGLAAKPVIDIDIVVTPSQLAKVIQSLEEGGYEHIGEYGIPDRHAFREPDGTVRHNLYACIEGCQALKNHLSLRDLCRQNEEIRNAYSITKLELAQQEWEDVNEYARAKTEIVGWILNQAGMTEQEREQIRTLNTIPSKGLEENAHTVSTTA